jgi:hypothetical protein
MGRLSKHGRSNGRFQLIPARSGNVHNVQSQKYSNANEQQQQQQQ